MVKVVIGMRRSGKSYRLFQEIESLLAKGISMRQICYFNFEDDRLLPITPQTGDAVLEEFYRMNPQALDGGAYLFFDEIQVMSGWDLWLRRIVDARKVTVYVAGSSSKLLSSEVATGFRGRALEYELLPFSFAERLRASGVSLSGLTTTTGSVRLYNELQSYLVDGGLPGTFGLSRQEAIPLLQSYAQQVVARDVVERHDLARPRVASMFAQRVVATNGRELSIRKIEDDLRSMGLATGREYLSGLLSYLEESYLLMTVREYSRSLAEGASRGTKVYAIDPGLAFALSPASTQDDGQRLEQVVYLELRRHSQGSRMGMVFSCKTSAGHEVDFIVGDALLGSAELLVQVTMGVEDPRTLARETRSLWEAMRERGLRESLLIVGDGEERDLTQDGLTIHQVPAWRWLAQGGDTA